MEVFISPQRADSKHSGDIARHLQKFHAIDSYLDVAEPTVGSIRGLSQRRTFADKWNLANQSKAHNREILLDSFHGGIDGSDPKCASP